jgi:hypothetical protein
VKRTGEESLAHNIFIIHEQFIISVQFKGRRETCTSASHKERKQIRDRKCIQIYCRSSSGSNMNITELHAQRMIKQSSVTAIKAVEHLDIYYDLLILGRCGRGTSQARGGYEIQTKFWSENLNERDGLEHLGKSGVIILQWILKP